MSNLEDGLSLEVTSNVLLDCTGDQIGIFTSDKNALLAAHYINSAQELADQLADAIDYIEGAAYTKWKGANPEDAEKENSHDLFLASSFYRQIEDLLIDAGGTLARFRDGADV